MIIHVIHGNISKEYKKINSVKLCFVDTVIYFIRPEGDKQYLSAKINIKKPFAIQPLKAMYGAKNIHPEWPQN